MKSLRCFESKNDMNLIDLNVHKKLSKGKDELGLVKVNFFYYGAQDFNSNQSTPNVKINDLKLVQWAWIEVNQQIRGNFLLIRPQ